MELKPGDKVLAFSHFNQNPAFLPGRVRQIIKPMHHVAVEIRPDYRQLVDGAIVCVVPAEFIFTTVEMADAWITKVDQELNKFVSAHDASEEAWATLPEESTEYKPLTPVLSKDGQTKSADESPHEHSVLSSNDQQSAQQIDQPEEAPAQAP